LGDKLILDDIALTVNLYIKRMDVTDWSPNLIDKQSNIID
jgi:hypothetical protein